MTAWSGIFQGSAESKITLLLTSTLGELFAHPKIEFILNFF